MARLSEQLRERIEDSIVTGHYPPGTRLDEVELALRFGVSRTPTREALIHLSTEGFIEKRPRKGWEVTEIDAARLCEMFDVMAELEALCARQAARRASDRDVQRIAAAHDACRKAAHGQDPDIYFRLNEAFHQAIYDASQNQFLIEQVGLLQRRLRPYRRLQLRVRDRMVNSFDEHDRVVRAIIAGDAGLAASEMRCHVVVQGERFADLVASVATISVERAANF